MSVVLNYRIDGSGRRIVLLHPVCLDLTFFDSLTSELSPHYQTLRVDLRGHGNSPTDRNEVHPRVEDYAQDVHALLKVLRYTPAVIIGFSFGGMVAQELTLQHPEDVSTLVAGACGCSFTEETRSMLRARGTAMEQSDKSAVLESTLERWFSAAYREKGEDASAKEHLLHCDVTSWKQAWEAISGLNTAPRLHTIKVPVLCLAGENDLSTPPAMVKTVAESIPGARFVVIPNTPHMLFLEKPKDVANAIADFLEDVPV